MPEFAFFWFFIGLVFTTIGALALRYPKRAADFQESLERRTPLRIYGGSVRFVAVVWVVAGPLAICVGIVDVVVSR